MPRPKKLSDEELFRHTLAIMEEGGGDAVTFAALAARSGLSGATLVQRFGTKQAMVHAALLHAWDGLDASTARLSAETERTPAGAVELLYRLSGSYGDIDRYANRLQVLREDFRDPELRARGAAWIGALAAVVDECFAGHPENPGLAMVAQWQGTLLLWGFSPDGRKVDDFVRDHLERFVASFMR